MFKIGDQVRVARGERAGRVGKVVEVGKGGALVLDCPGFAPGWYAPSQLEHAAKFKVGDRVRVVCGCAKIPQACAHEEQLATVNHVFMRQDDETQDYELKFDAEGLDGGAFGEALLEAAPSQSLPLAVGDRVRVIGWMGKPKGVILSGEGAGWFTVRCDSGMEARFMRHDLEPIAESPAEPPPPPRDYASLSDGDDVSRWGKDLAGEVRCLRCGGPAGFLGIACRRIGGCRTAEERVAARGEPIVAVRRETWNGYTDEIPSSRPCNPQGRGEVSYSCLDPRRVEQRWFPSEALALADWRERALAEERGR